MRKTLTILAFLILGLLGGAAALHLFSFRYIEKYFLSNGHSELAPVQIIEKREIAIRENEAIVEGVRKVRGAIVGVRTGTRAGFIEGSAVIISSDGLLVVLNDLIPPGGNFKFFVDQEEVSFEIEKRDAQKNLALVRIDRSDLPTLEFGNEERLNLGERVFLVGAVFNDQGRVVTSVNEGIARRIDNFITTNIFEEKKLSGSPLFDIEGRLFGLNLIAADGRVYAIPISRIREFAGL